MEALLQGGDERVLQHHRPSMLALPPARRGPDWTQINTPASRRSLCSRPGMGEAIPGHLVPSVIHNCLLCFLARFPGTK